MKVGMNKIISLFSSSQVKLFLAIVATFLVAILIYHFLFFNKVYPGIRIAGTNVSGKTLEGVEQTTSNLPKPEKMTLNIEGKKYEFATKELGLEYRIDKTASRAFEIGRKGSLGKTFRDKWKALTRGVNIPFSISLDSQKVDTVIEKIATDFYLPSVETSVNIQGKTVVVNPGKSGQEVKKEEIREKISQSLAFIQTNEIAISLEKVNPQLSEEEAKTIQERAIKLLGKQIQIAFERENFTYTDRDLVTVLGPSELFVNQEKAQTLVSDLAKGVNREAQDARFEFTDGIVKEFTPAKQGIKVNEEEALNKAIEALKILITTEEKVATIDLPVQATKPEIQNQDVNNLGINELIGQGESIYRGSIPSRVHNLSLAASRLNGILIRPGEEFSFNKAVGNISSATGYQQAYVIKEGKTILDDGGGVCQTSTTFFRAALNTGLPIIERHQHSYRVSYYEQGSKPGYDAAIYLPNVDLRIRNDTPGHILIQAKNDTKNAKLVFEFYGTSDGRQVELLNYRQWDARPAPPDLYQDDPTQPVGAVKQVERSIPGLKTAFDYKVSRNGETIFEKIFYSNFRTWQAVYLRGTAPN